MRLLFWISAGLLTYVYFGYPLWLWVRSRWRNLSVPRRDIVPPVSIIIAVYNEAAVLEDKLRNLASLDYPADRLQVVIVSDGSTDDTNAILERHREHVQVLICEHQGKAAALNQALAVVTGEILVFTDARQRLERDAVRKLVSNFAAAEVGCVSGELFFGSKESHELGRGLGLYWSLEKLVRRLEAVTGSMVGVSGSLYAARKQLVTPLPLGAILDDVLVPMRIVRRGYRVVWEAEARAWDEIANARDHEFRRKVRTLLGNYQLLKLAPWLLTRDNPLLFEFISHKLLRLAGPALLIALLISSLALNAGVYRWALVAQLLFYGLAAIAATRPKLGVLRRGADAALAFLVLNTAAAVAFIYLVTGKKGVWTR